MIGIGMVGADSNYAEEVSEVISDGERRLAKRQDRPPHDKKKVIDLDIDDTTLTTWNLVVAGNGKQHRPRTDYVDNQHFFAVPGMVDPVKTAQKQGYAIFSVTSRRATSRKCRWAT